MRLRHHTYVAALTISKVRYAPRSQRPPPPSEQARVPLVAQPVTGMASLSVRRRHLVILAIGAGA